MGLGQFINDAWPWSLRRFSVQGGSEEGAVLSSPLDEKNAGPDYIESGKDSPMALDTHEPKPSETSTSTDSDKALDFEKAETHDDDENASVSELPQGRQLGIISAIFLMVNRILGTGVFSTTSTIYQQSGSVGMSIIYWAIGGVIAGMGFAVYAEFAAAMQRNGGELNYLQYTYRKPKYLIASLYASQAFLLGQAAGNANTAGQYFIRAGGGETKEWNSKGIGVAILAAALFMHSVIPKWGLIFQNVLGAFKVVILLVIVIAGFVALGGHTKAPRPHNFSNAFEGTRNGIYPVAQCIYTAVWSYVGYSNLFYALGEVRNPVRTLKIAGAVSLITLTVLYVLSQVAYFAAVSKNDALQSTQIIAAKFFENMFGERATKALSTFVALSAVANVFSVLFSQGRLNQALGRDGLLPFSKFFASNKPFKTPLAGLAWHTIVTLILMLAPPQGDAYVFVLSLAQYPLNLVNSAVGLGLCMLYLPDNSRIKPDCFKNWSSPFKATLPIALFFTLVSMFLVVVPWIGPDKQSVSQYKDMWYGMAPAVGLGICGAGGVYWVGWYVLAPWIGRYRLQPERMTLKDGTVITHFARIPK